MADNDSPLKKSSKSFGRSSLLSLYVFLIFSLSFYPVIIVAWGIFYFIPFNEFWHFLILPFLVYVCISILIISLLLIPGAIIRIFRVRYNHGVYEYSYKNKMAFKWMLVCSLYTTGRKIIEMLPLGFIKNYYYRLFGMKIGKNALVGGVIKDPCVTKFGNNTTMGEYAIIYGHIHNYSEGTITIKNVEIGNNCIIGAGAIIMPGAKVEDGVTIAAGAVVTQNQVLKKGSTYVGIPAKELKRKD